MHATNEEIMGKVTASGGQGYDVLFVSSPFAEALHKLELIAPIDHAKVPNLAGLYPEAQELAHDPGNTFSVPYTWGTTGLCWRSDLVPDAPTSWNDLLKPADALKGKTTMLATDRWLLGAGFLAQGHSVNTTDQGEIDAARDLLIEAKRTLLAYDDTTFYSKLVSGGVAGPTPGTAGELRHRREPGDPVRGSRGEQRPLGRHDGDHRASENQDAAHKFIDFVLDPANGAWVASNVLYKVPSKAAMDAVDPALKEQYPNLAMAPADSSSSSSSATSARRRRPTPAR